jgi:hypothetical protein
MPSPASQSAATNKHRVIQLQPEMTVQDHSSAASDRYFAAELAHWLSDLKSRKEEGEHYLNWFSCLEPEISDTAYSSALSRLLGGLPALQRLIHEQMDRPDYPRIEGIQSLQQQFFRFCDHFDQIRLLMLKEMNWWRGLSIY